jgi:hypothetical protein
LESAPLLQKLLGSFLIRPEVRRGGLDFDTI